jgi:thiosulfate/3-mercaptopyruvate sulfurtransferase
MSLSNWLTKPLALFVVLVLIAACSASETHTGVAADMPMDSLVTAEWLSENLNDPNLVVLDCTVLIQPDGKGGFDSASGRDQFDKGHIPTAGFADLKGELSDGESPFGFAVPTPEQFATAMSALGVSDDSRVVLYDAGGSLWAARVWWMLRWIGFDQAALLDGGLAAWTAQGLPLSTEPVSRPAGTLTVALRPELIVGKGEVLAAIGDDSVSIIDALPEAQYSGEMSMYARPGHITSATNVPVMSLINETGQYLPADELEKRFTGDRDSRTITYCGGGIAASANAFVMTRLGYKDVAVYTASLQEWAADESLPMEVAAISQAINE